MRHQNLYNGKHAKLLMLRHGAIALLALLVGVVLFSIALDSVSAFSGAWGQTDWSGGAAASTAVEEVDTYVSANNVTTADAGSFRLNDENARIAALSGNQATSGSDDFNVSAATTLSYNLSQKYDDSTFSYSAGSPGNLVVDRAGDYLVSVNFPVTSNNSSGNRNNIQVQISVNGAKRNVSVGRGSYIRNTGSHNESSAQLVALLEDLSPGDFITVSAFNTTNSNSNKLTSTYLVYAEWISDSRTVGYFTSTSTGYGSNLNQSESALLWNSRRKDAGIGHSTGGSPSNITLENGGTYLVSINIPLQSTVQRSNILGRVKLDGSEIPGGKFAQGYIRTQDDHNEGSIHWFGLVNATAGQQLSVSLEQESESGTVTTGSDVGTLFVEELSSEGFIHLGGTQVAGDNDWNEAPLRAVDWSAGYGTDSSLYSHSTSGNNDEVTVLADGDYLLVFNAAFTSNVQRSNMRMQVAVNGSLVDGAVTKSAYIRNGSNHNQGSSTMLVPLTDLNAGDVITLTVQQEAASGDVDDTTEATVAIINKGYPALGYLNSNIFDPGYDANWADIDFTTSGSGNIVVKARTGTDAALSGAPDWSSCSALTSGGSLTDSSCVTNGEQFFQYRVELSPNGTSTPVFEEVNFTYSPIDIDSPVTNANTVNALGISSGDWVNEPPTITWNLGADNAGGSGILGYCVSLDEAELDTSDVLDPLISAGVLAGIDDGILQDYCPYIVTGNSLDLTAIDGLNLVSGQEYFLSLKAVDFAGNVWTGASGDYQDLVSFKFDNVPPQAPGYISMPGNFISTKNVTITWPAIGDGVADDADSGLVGLQYRIGSNGVWYGDSHNGNEDQTDVLVNDGAYTTDETHDYPVMQEGINEVYMRAIDLAGNVSPYITSVLKLNTSAPGSIQNLTVAPADNDVNSYAFDWEAPATFTGAVDGITYCYTVNTLPSVSTCSYTDPGVTELDANAYATQPGTNTMFVVARDEAGNVNYDTYDSTTFTYNGSAPGIPLNLDIADVSIKSTADWKVALTWTQPDQVGAGISYYKVYRSEVEAACATNLVSFVNIGNATGKSFVDTELESKNYYYCVSACDSANNCSATSETVVELPTGKFTEPAALVFEPQASQITTRKAVINWSTDRDSDSRIQLGLASGTYQDEEISNSEQSAAHTITLNNLDPGTTYYYRAKWADEDGNVGVSEEYSFTTDPPPELLSVQATNVTVDSAIISFRIRDAAQATILYGLSESFGGAVEIPASTVENQYAIPLNNLQDGSKYFFKIRLQDIEGNEYDTLETKEFNTLPRPRVSDIEVEEVKNTAQPTVRAVWESNTPVSSIISYYPTDNPSNTLDIVDIDPKLQHDMQILALLPDTSYSMRVRGIDSFGNEAVSDVIQFTTATDSRPPEISKVRVNGDVSSVAGGQTAAQLVVTWETDEPATSQVEYGEGVAGPYSASTQLDLNLKYQHLIVIPNLRTSSVYHLRIITRDEAGNETVSSNVVTVTPQESQDAFELVVGRLGEVFSFLGN